LSLYHEPACPAWRFDIVCGLFFNECLFDKTRKIESIFDRDEGWRRTKKSQKKPAGPDGSHASRWYGRPRAEDEVIQTSEQAVIMVLIESAG